MRCNFTTYPQAKLHISDLKIEVHLGCTPEERQHSQLVSLDIVLIFDTPPLGVQTDFLKDTICYAKIVEHVQLFLQKYSFNLIEAMAGNIYQIINQLLTTEKCSVAALQVKVHKVAPPVPGVQGGVFFTYGDVLYNNTRLLAKPALGREE